ncbi:protein FAR-RED ELONGATED HYPOCOTYL 3-like [Dioscorea cayenensis subsp. rotundata]|uniref:Protein FAR1-RELATED SEQUENCE n=1 Tax=Dioscorea cayennensis subsp. rotundata TaxID=55577 RepID=A0AB40CUX1_DIOCR|nr:protein FAR-RED ELONGATED HYPOCOTYL 3-like [Dioscorea cayenensis subsp. rotundata]
MSFEFVGYLCSHVLKVLDIWNLKVVPSQYMLNRWTKHALDGCVVDYKGRIVKEDPRQVVSNRSKDLSRSAVTVASRAAQSEDASIFFARKMVELSLEVENFFTKADKNVDDGYFNSMAMNSSQSVDINDAFTSEQNEISKVEEKKVSLKKGKKTRKNQVAIARSASPTIPLSRDNIPIIASVSTLGVSSSCVTSQLIKPVAQHIQISNMEVVIPTSSNSASKGILIEDEMDLTED